MVNLYVLIYLTQSKNRILYKHLLFPQNYVRKRKKQIDSFLLLPFILSLYGPLSKYLLTLLQYLFQLIHKGIHVLKLSVYGCKSYICNLIQPL